MLFGFHTFTAVQELTFETQFLSAISLVTAILLGNTFAFSFDRQVCYYPRHRRVVKTLSEASIRSVTFLYPCTARDSIVTSASFFKIK